MSPGQMPSFVARFLAITGCIALAAHALGQAPGVAVYEDGPQSRSYDALTNAVNRIRDSGKSLAPAAVREQLRRGSCRLDLPQPNHRKFTAREVWDIARGSHVRVGWSYLCHQCDEWHLRLSGGYVLTSDGAVATSYHGVQPPHDLRDGRLVAADDFGRVFPVIEVLAGDRYADACVIRIQGEGKFNPLPLNTDMRPGDTVYCFSDPLGRRGYFSHGIINRFVRLSARRRSNEPGAPLFEPTRIEVSADWAPGSSGAAVLDEFGNAIGHVSLVSFPDEEVPSPGPGPARDAASASIIFHQAVSARDVLLLIKPAR
jgi:S1-C subfamily serine protease